MPQFKTQKFKVPNNTVGVLLQEELIKKGYRWGVDGVRVRTDNITFYYTEDNGRITFGSTQDYFNAHRGEEMLVVTESRLVVAELKPRRDKVIVFGRTYYKDDVDRALARLEIAQP